jgi:hypothetical protein
VLFRPVAVLKKPLAVLNAPVAVLALALAVLPTPVAVLTRPLAVLSAPVAVLKSPLAKLFAPVAVLESPLAELPAPVAVLCAAAGVGDSDNPPAIATAAQHAQTARGRARDPARAGASGVLLRRRDHLRTRRAKAAQPLNIIRI